MSELHTLERNASEATLNNSQDLLSKTLIGSTVCPDSVAPFIYVTIFINAWVIFLEPCPALSANIKSTFKMVDYVCAWIFIVELIYKVRVFGWKEYFSYNWNKFDFAIVAISSPVVLTPFFDLSSFQMVLFLRAARLFRLFKIFSFFSGRERLFTGILRALKASITVCFGLLFILAFSALGSTIFFGDIAPELFGDPFTSSYSMFQIFTIEGWYEIPTKLAAAHQEVWWHIFVKAYFITFVVIGGMFGLGMLNAVFVDALMEDNNEGIERRLDRIERILRRNAKPWS